MKTKFTFSTLALVAFVMLFAQGVQAQKNSARVSFKATNAQFGTEVQYARDVLGFLSVTATAGYSSVQDQVDGAELRSLNGSTRTLGLGLEYSPFGNNQKGLYIQANALRLNSDFSASSGNSYSFLSNANCENFQSDNTNNSFSLFGNNTTYTGEVTNFMLDTRVGYRINIKGSRFSFAPFVAFEKVISNTDNVVLSSGEGSVNFATDRSLRTQATQINNSSVSVDLDNLYKSNRFNTGFEFLIKF